MTATTHEIGTTVRIPIADFVVDANIRKDTTMPKEFLASVKQHGVLVPVDAYLNPDDGKWHLQDGQLRYLASVDVGRADIPVLVADPTLAAAIRVQRQLILNDRRNELTERDRVGAYQTLFELGVSADQIARKTNTPAKRVQTALAIAASPYASEVIASAPVLLDHAAAIIEFEDDAEAAEKLTQVAIESPGQFDHTIERLRQERELKNAIETLEQELAQAGYRIIEAPERHPNTGTTLFAAHLYSDEKLTTPLVTGDARPDTTIEGLAAYVTTANVWENNTYQQIPRAHFVVEGWEAAGYFSHDYRTGNSNGSANEGGGLSDKEKAARKVVRDNNKLWRPATTVRREWVKEFLKRKELPADALTYATQYFGALPHWTTNQLTILTEWLSLNPTRDSITKHLTTDPKRALNILLAAALAAAEGDYDFGKDGWRRSVAAAYLQQLSKWGYTLSDIEQAVVAGKAEKGIG